MSEVLSYFTLRNIILLLISIGILSGLFFIKVKLKDHLGYTGTLIRKLVHMTVALWAVWAFYGFDNRYVALVLPVCFILLHIGPVRTYLYRTAHLEGDFHPGTLYFPITIVLLFWFCWRYPARWAALIGLLNMGIGDAFAGLIGAKYGVRTYTFRGATKSYLGASVMLVSCTVCTACVLFIASHGVSFNTFGIAVIIATTATILEGLSGNGLDNLSVPLGSALCYSFFYPISW